MAYIFGLIVVALLFMAMHYFTELTKQQKLIASAIILALISFAIFYNNYSDMQRDLMLQNVTKFRQNKTLQCSGTEVNSTNFTLSIGTYTFIGKENTPFYGQMISASTCQ